MITFANLYQIYVQTDGMWRLEFKVADPTGQAESETTSIIYMKFADIAALNKTLSELIGSVLSSKLTSAALTDKKLN
jgi:hypothetical protein